MAQVRIKNLTQHRIYVPVPVGIMMRPAQEVILSEISDDLLAQSKKISRLVEKRVIQVWIQPQDPDIDDSLETRYINVGGGLPLHGSTHYDGGSDPIDIDQLRTSGGIPGYIMEAGPGGSISWVPHTVPPHAVNHADGGSDEIDVVTLGSTSAPAAGYLPASDGANGLSWVSPSAPGAHKATHYEGGSDSIDVADLSSASAGGADRLVRSDGTGGLTWTSAGTPGTIQPDDTAADGVASTYARSDHRHAVVADTAGTIQPDDTAAEGTSTSFARADHRHAIVTAAPIAVTPGDPAAEGTSTSFARADHQHSVPAFAAPGTIQPDDTADAGTASSFARSDHRHAITAATPGTIEPDDVAGEGSANTFARSDHQHAIVAAAPGSVVPDDTPAEGTSTSFARADHTHGVSAFGTPGTIQPDDTAAQGTASTFARSDHTHAIVAATPGTIQPDDTAAEGTSTSFARADHTHAITAAAPLQGVGGGNQEGTATSFARSDHDHTTRETGGPTDLTTGAIPDGYSVRRSGTSLVGINPYDPARTIVVATNAVGADATTIAGGITAVNALSPVPSVTAPATILVHPGVYPTPPFVLPNYVTLIGTGGAEATIIEATTTTAAICTANGGSSIEDITFRNANGVGGIGIDVGGTTGPLHVEHCYVDNCTTGIRSSGASKVVHIVSCEVLQATNGLLVDAGGTARLDGLCIKTSTYSLRVGTANGTVNGNNLRVLTHAGETWHVWVEGATSDVTLTGSYFREDRTSYNAGATVNVQHMSIVAGDEAMQVTAEFHVGTEYRPRESAFGGGDSHTRGMAALTNTNLEAGIWTDITTQLRDEDATTAALFAGVGIGNCFYIGGDIQFPGLKPKVTTARSGGTLVLEYWNGTAWTQIPHLSCDANAPYGQYAQDALSRVNSEQIRFGTAAITGWATKNLNGITKYWVRWRVTTALTTIPICDRVKLHTNRTEVNSDGVVEHFGAAEPVRQLLWHRSLMEELVGFAQPDVNIDIAAGLSIRGLNNRWQNGNKDGSTTLLQALPGLDTSRPLVYVVGWAPETTDVGNVEVQLDIVTVNPGNVLNGTLPYTAQLSQIVTGPFTAYTLQTTQFTFTVPNLTTVGSLAMALYRDGGGGNLDDTFNGDAMHVYSAVYGTFWR